MATAWNPSAFYDTEISANVFALAVSGTTVYVGGSFLGIGGQTRHHIAALDATVNSNMATAWNPNANQLVDDLVVDGTTVYAGGYFTSIGGQVRRFIAALDASGGMAISWNPNANHLVRTLSVSGTTVYAGGDFSSMGNLPQSNVAAIDADATGIPDPHVSSIALLGQNLPNPFSNSTMVPFYLATRGDVTLKIYDLAGREVSTLLQKERRESGAYMINFDARKLASGVYFYRLQVGHHVEVRKMVLARLQ